MILIDDQAGSGPRTVTRRLPSGRRTIRTYKGLTDFPPLNDPAIATLCRLDSADVCFTGNGPTGPILIGVEVKSIPDLLSSFDTGRLQATQLPNMLATYQMSWLLYYGTHRCGGNGELETLYRNPHNGHLGFRPYTLGKRPVSFSMLKAALMEISSLGIHYDHVAGDTTDACLAQCAQWIGCLYRLWSKPYSAHKLMRTFDRSRPVSTRDGSPRSCLQSCVSPIPGVPGVPGIQSPDPKFLLRATIANDLPGIGYEKAQAAARHFPSVQAMINATAEEWAEIKVETRGKTGRVARIGKVIAKAVTEAVTEVVK